MVWSISTETAEAKERRGCRADKRRTRDCVLTARTILADITSASSASLTRRASFIGVGTITDLLNAQTLVCKTFDRLERWARTARA